MSEEKKKLTLNKELSVFNEFVAVNVFEKDEGKKQLITIKQVYKPQGDNAQWKSTDFINIKKIDTLINMLNELKIKLKGE